MKPSLAAKKINRKSARNATLLNLAATPGLGSLVAGRWAEGLAQIFLAVTGFVLVLIWFIHEMIPYYGQMFSDTPPPAVGFKMLGWGFALFALAWVWSLVTSLSLSRAAGKLEAASLEVFAG